MGWCVFTMTAPASVKGRCDSLVVTRCDHLLNCGATKAADDDDENGTDTDQSKEKKTEEAKNDECDCPDLGSLDG